MAGQYSLRSFLRQAGNAFLEQYLGAWPAFAGFGWAGIAETDTTELLVRWDNASEAERTGADAAFLDIHTLGDELGWKDLIEEARFHGEDLAESLAEFDDHVDRAFWAFLNRPKYFENALRFALADRLPNRSWHKLKGLPRTRPDDAVTTRHELSAALSLYFRRKEGRGRSCTVEVYRRAQRYYFFVFLEDHARADQDFEGGSLQRRPHRPAFEVIFAFDPEAGTLDTFAPGGRRVVRDLQEQFALIALGAPIVDPDSDERVYELEQMRDPDFRFTYPATTAIADAVVHSLRFALRYEVGTRITIEGSSRNALSTLYNKVAGDGGLPASMLQVTRAEIRVSYLAVGNRTPRAKTIRITWPNLCSLGHDERDDALRQMLVDSGIDPSGLSFESRR